MTDSVQPPAVCEHGIRSPWQCHDCDATNQPPPGYNPLAPTQPPAETLARAKRLKYYPDYIDDPDGLARFRHDVETTSGHDMAAVNHNSLGRLIDTIERLRFERDTARAALTRRAGGDEQRSNRSACAHGDEGMCADCPRDAARSEGRSHG